MRIHTICNCSAHMFPVSMRYGGRRWWNGRLAYVMYCPVSHIERIYIRAGYRGFRRVA